MKKPLKYLQYDTVNISKHFSIQNPSNFITHMYLHLNIFIRNNIIKHTEGLFSCSLKYNAFHFIPAISIFRQNTLHSYVKSINNTSQIADGNLLGVAAVLWHFDRAKR